MHEQEKQVQEMLSEFELEEKNDLTALMEQTLEKRDRVSQLEQELKEAKQNKAIADKELISKMNEIGLSSMDGLGKKFIVKEAIYSRVNKNDRQKLFDWLFNHDLGSMVTQQVNSQTLDAFFRKDYDPKEHGEIPDFVKQYKEPKLSVSKGREK